MKKRILLFMVMFVMLSLLVLGLSACGGDSSAPAQSEAPVLTPPPSTVNVPLPPEATAPASGGESEPAEKEYGGTVRMVVTVDTAYPFGIPWNSAANVATQVQVPFSETLLIQYTNGTLLPWLASAWRVDVENEEAVLTLREDVNFSDGTKFNAEVAAWNFERMIEEKAANPSIAAVEVRGEYEIAIKMAGGFSNAVLPLLASRAYGMTSRENYEKVGADAAGEYPVCTGPFLLKEKVPGSKVTFEKSPNYWIPGKPYLDTFEYHAITDVMTQTASMLSKGDDRIDVLMQNNGEQIQTLLQDPDLEMFTYASGFAAIYPSSRNPDSPFANLAVRQATSAAIDRQLLCDARGFGVLEPAKQMIVNGFMGWFDDGRNYYPYDPAAAKDLLASAGYPNGIDTTLIIPQSTDREMAVAVQNMLADVGIRCEMEFPEPGLYTELRSTTGWEGLVMGAFTNITSMTSTYRLQLDPDYQYYISTWRPVEEMLPIYDASRVTPELDQGLFQQLHAMMADNMVVMPLLSANTTFIVNKAVRDGGFGQYGLGTIYRPEEIWRSTK